jgi:Fe2+ or Zn2+ uptake regulation protein
MNTLASEWDTCLQQIGCRLTSPRQAVISTLAETKNPLSPLEIYDLARKIYPRLGLVTVYRTLERLEHLSLIRRVVLGSKGLTYLPARSETDVFLLCAQCGHVEQTHEQALELLLQHLGQKLGYQIMAQALEISGTCASCHQTSTATGETK